MFSANHVSDRFYRYNYHINTNYEDYSYLSINIVDLIDLLFLI